MEYTLDVPDYDPSRGVRTQWEHGAEIAVAFDGRGVVISANAEGLMTLARTMLAVASAHVGSHMHLDDIGGLQEGSAELIIELVDNST